MALRTLSFEVAAADAEPLSEALLEAGAQSVSVEDAHAGTALETPRFDEPGEVPRPWERNRVVALFGEGVRPEEALAQALRSSGCAAPGSFQVEALAERDWVRAVQDNFVPIRIADRLWVVPSWCEPPEPGALNLRIDPGLAFGTGSHPSTRMALAWLAQTLQPGSRPCVLDYGCGSGILAIAADRLGAGETFAVDIDPQALASSAANAAANSASLRLYLPDELPPIRADIVVANILARPLIVLAPLLAGRAAGRIALSGILEAQADDVIERYAEWFDLAVSAREEGWVLVSGQRR